MVMSESPDKNYERLMSIFVKCGAELQSQLYLNWSRHHSVLANATAASYTNRKIKRWKEKKGMKKKRL